MGTPNIHAELSARRFGGKPEDYIEIHVLMDSSKETLGDLRHRALTHNTWFITKILERVFGFTITNSDNKQVSVREIGQWHIMEDFSGAIPTAQDYLQQITFQPWMNNGENDEVPPSNAGLPNFDKSLLEPKNKPRPIEKAMEGAKDFLKNPLPEYEDPPSRGCGGGGRID